MKKKRPIVMISSYPPRHCGIATFCEEAREFIQKRKPERQVLVISHSDGEGEGVYPLIDMNNGAWWKDVAAKINELKPYAVHIEHEYALYEYKDERGHGDSSKGILNLLDAINEWPIIIEPHTVHGRLQDHEAEFLYNMCKRVDVVLFKCHYQKWRLKWNFLSRGWKVPANIKIVPHGARTDRRWGPEQISDLRAELGLNNIPYLGNHLVGLVGWIQSNKRWDILTSMWEDIAKEIYSRTGQQWDLLAAGAMRDPNHKKDYKKYRRHIEILEKKGLAHYFEFVPRGDIYYKVMAVCDFIVLPSIDETQSGTLARIIAMNKPYITTAPLEGLTAQTLESDGGLLFTTKKMLKEKVIRLACDEKLRYELGESLKRYLENDVGWEVVARQYDESYTLAREAKRRGIKVKIPPEF